MIFIDIVVTGRDKWPFSGRDIRRHDFLSGR